MNKYSEWTDNQINFEVAERRGTFVYDYCNDWGNAGPILYEMEISIDWAGLRAVYVDIRWVMVGFEDRSRALRAAMEVYLMLTDGE